MGLRHRATELREIMDVERPSLDEVAGSLKFLRAINRWLGGWRTTLRHLDGVRLVLDVAAGGADTAEAVARRFDARVVALDLSADVLALARSTVRDSRVMFVRGDAHRLPFRDGAFDAATCALFFHHLTEEGAVALLRAMDRVARAIVVNDFIRRRRLLWWTYVFTGLRSNRLVRVDGPISVRKAFTPEEFEALRDRAGLPYLRVHVHFGHRMALAGRKGS